MKIVLDKLYLFLIFLFEVVENFAKNLNWNGEGIIGSNPPSPDPTGKPAGPGSPPGLPINEDMLVLIIIALMLGFYFFYKYSLKTKVEV